MIEGIQQYEESGIKNGEDSWTLHEYSGPKWATVRSKSTAIK